VYQTVDSFVVRIERALREEHTTPDVWIVVIPEYIYANCRPLSVVAPESRIEPRFPLSSAQALSAQSWLFEEQRERAKAYRYVVNFHHQLKARLLRHKIPVQVVREIKIAFRDFRSKSGQLMYDFERLESAIAWNLSTTLFYKAGGRPWKLGAGRERVCYVGLVFKEMPTPGEAQTACCGAQMFLDSGDGVVFRGAVGPWYGGRRGVFHLDRDSAKELVEMCLTAYAERRHGEAPDELFVHGRVGFDTEEWDGFQAGAGTTTRVVGVRILPVSSLKLFRRQKHPVLRGTAYLMNDNQAFLWSKGLVPRLRTYPGREVPNPLLVDVCRGKADLHTVLSDILALTKLNYNACNFSDGMPVTLKFADAVGQILTAGPRQALDVPPLPFKYYI
jgi:hypothetical protein